MQAADTSCYAAKEQGRNRVHTWHDTERGTIDRVSDPVTKANLMAASGVLAGLRLDDEVIYRILRRDIMQESTVYRSIQREAQEERERSIALNLLREGISIETIVRSTGLSIEAVQQLQKQPYETSH